jgi:hypothetical protein
MKKITQYRFGDALLFGIFGLSLLSTTASFSAVPQAFLVQNSGWMEPFYSDSKSQLKPLVKAFATTVAEPNAPLLVAAFNQSSPNNVSPKISNVTAGSNLDAAVDNIALAKKANGALADTDFQEAVAAVITQGFRTESGIIWIFTNNKNSPNNSPETAAKNREFYELLHTDASITRTLAFPLKMPVQGKQYAASGLMVYALAYGQAADVALQNMLDNGTIAKVLTDAPARLKPLNQDSLKLTPEAIVGSEGVTVSTAADGRTIVLDVDARFDASTFNQIRLRAKVENRFYPYTIRQGTIFGQLRGDGWSYAVDAKPANLANFNPGQTQSVEFDIALPTTTIPSKWAPSSLALMGKAITRAAAIDIEVRDQSLAVSPGFTQRLADTFPQDPLSEVFFPPTVKQSNVSIPVALRISYPIWPLLVIIALGILILVALAAALSMMGKPSRVEILADGNTQKIPLGRFKQAVIQNAAGEKLGVIKRGLFSTSVVEIVPGHTISIK